ARCWLGALLFFFFQAEDGIRDFHVTGVQTCALPISKEAPASDTTQVDLTDSVGEVASSLWDELKQLIIVRRLDQPAEPLLPPERSEERRVGKECRSRGGP